MSAYAKPVEALTMLGSDTELLALLGDGEFHSGQRLAEHVGVSRAAIWKRIHKLRLQGFNVETSHGRGYKLGSPVELLDAQRILGRLSPETRTSLTSLIVEGSVDSTNTVLLRQLREGIVGHGAVLLAEQQTQGRGRRGRSWISPFAKNIYCSFVWCFDTGISGLDGLSLVIGIAVIRALNAVGVNGLSLKWPNDVLAGEGKLAGILIEVDGDMEGPTFAVIGIGVNIAMPTASGAAIDQPWTDVQAISQAGVGRNQISAYLLDACFDSLKKFCAHGFATFSSDWNELDALRGEHVQLTLGPGRSVEGRAMGVDASGALLIQTENGLVDYHGGEVSIRRMR